MERNSSSRDLSPGAGDGDGSLPVPPAIGWRYFGCHRDSGHYRFGPQMQRAEHSNVARDLTMFDGALAPRGHRRPQLAALTRLGGLGISALSWWDHSVDGRPGSNSIVFAPSLTARAATILLGAQRWFPSVFERQPAIILDASCFAGGMGRAPCPSQTVEAVPGTNPDIGEGET